MKKTVIFLFVANMAMVAKAQINNGANTLGGASSSIGGNNTIYGQWSLSTGDGNSISSTASNSFASGLQNTLSKAQSFAFGASNNIGESYSGAFGIANTVQTPYSFALGYNNTVSGSHSTAIGKDVTVSGANSFVFGSDITNSRSYSFLVGFNANDPAFSVEKGTSSSGPLVGIGTAIPQSRLDIRLEDQQDIIVQSEVPNTHAGLVFRHSDGTENWRIRSYSNFAGGYGNMLAIMSAGQQKDNLWIVANKTLIGDFFDFDTCTDCDEFKLFVRKGIRTERVKVDIASGIWADYVFEEDYQLKPLAEVEEFIVENKHLPGVPSAKDVEAAGLDLAKMDAKLLEKVEELTLYIIALEKKIEEQERQIKEIVKP